MLQTYFTEQALLRPKGMVALDPNLVRLLSAQPPLGTAEVRIDLLQKGMQGHLLECHEVTLLDESALLKNNKRTIQGAVPKIHVLAERVQNKKVTSVGGPGNTLELFLVDCDELAAYLAKKCAASASVRRDVAGQRETAYCVVQGKWAAEVEQVLVTRYQIPKQYISVVDKLPEKKKQK